MKIVNMLEGLDLTTPPFQPKINANVNMYKEKLTRWNPVCVKRDALFYQFTTGGEEISTLEVIPDACINILFKCEAHDASALLSGIFVEKKELQLEPNTTYFGFKPYSNLGMLFPNASCNELANKHTKFEEIYPDSTQLFEKLSLTTHFDERINLFINYANKHIINFDYIPGLVDYFTVMLCTSKGNLTLSEMGKTTGYSERYCREKFKASYGISPKRYSGMLRFQSVLKSLLDGERSSNLSSLAFDSGYFDEAHFIHEFKRFTSSSPYKYKKDYQKLQSVKNFLL